MMHNQYRGAMVGKNDTHGNARENTQDPKWWAKQQILRIEALSEEDVLSELQNIMEGHKYSWYRINDLLQARFEDGTLKFTLQDGDILFEWNNLCDEKRTWAKTGRFSVDNSDFNKDCLINLTILPFQAGLSVEGPLLVAANMDRPDVLLKELWVGPKDHESSSNYQSPSYVAEAGTLFSDPDDSEYVDEDDDAEIHGEEDTQDEFTPTTDGSDLEESETSSDGSYYLDHREIEGVGINIMEVNSEDEYSD